MVVSTQVRGSSGPGADGASGGPVWRVRLSATPVASKAMRQKASAALFTGRAPPSQET